MGWKATGTPTVRKQREKWTVRVEGIDTETGRARPKQLGTYASERAAKAALKMAVAEDVVPNRGTVGWLVHRWVASRTDISPKAREQYGWAARHIEVGLGAIRLDTLDRADVATWLEATAAGGELSRRSIQIFRNVLRAALADAVAEGLLARSPAARVPLPRVVAKPQRQRDADSWSHEEVDTFLATAGEHRWAAGFRLEVLYGLRRSELLALRWNDVDFDAGTVRIDEGVIPLDDGSLDWSETKNERSRRTIPVDAATLAGLAKHRREQAAERLAQGSQWVDHDLILTTATGNVVAPQNFDRTLARIVKRADVPRLSSHGLRHTAATHMVAAAQDLGELRAIADILGHSPEMLLRVYAHAMPQSLRAVADRIGARGS